MIPGYQIIKCRDEHGNRIYLANLQYSKHYTSLRPRGKLNHLKATEVVSSLNIIQIQNKK